jgi:hypothetical protein
MDLSDPDFISQELVNAAKNWLAIDGLWFLAVEERYGLDAAIACDLEAWQQFSVIEARRIKYLLGLPDNGGLDALERALPHRLFAYVNEQEIRRPDDHTLLYFMKTCRTQTARNKKELPLFPCKEIGIMDHTQFARTIDTRIETTCITCPPDPPEKGICCGWRFLLRR